ncbi:MAG: ABC transporter ATP-binding protein [Lachnospiraceae bacterium]|nr:ABC transporter ATP-binding protein [Lachnospiraceae bacterium]
MEKQTNNNRKDILLSVRNLKVQYTAGGEVIQAVNDVSFELKRGQTIGLVGETGAGKTTIAKSILRILPDPPAKVAGGEIFLKGQELLSIPEKEMRRIRGNKISMIFQDPMTALNPVFSVGSQIEEVIRLHNEKISNHEMVQKAMEMLELVGISRNRYHEYPHQFSGGMKQRVIIAMALACNPLLLLADEPTTALDVTIQAQVLDMMYRLKEQYHTSMIMITHDMGIVAEVCDVVAVVYAGEIVELAGKEALFDHPMHPYTRGLFDCIPDIGKKTDLLYTIPGTLPNPASLPEGCYFHPRCSYAAEACKQGRIPMTEVEQGHFSRCCRLEGQEEQS